MTVCSAEPISSSLRIRMGIFRLKRGVVRLLEYISPPDAELSHRTAAEPASNNSGRGDAMLHPRFGDSCTEQHTNEIRAELAGSRATITGTEPILGAASRKATWIRIDSPVEIVQ